MNEIAAVIILVGALLTALAALGMLRFPDVYTRLHAASKAGPLGAGLILLGAGISSGDPAIMIRALVGFLFLIVTSPVSAHLLSRAAMKSGIPPTTSTISDGWDDTTK
jgi:multicomponent Na+:H+ antiporter subunit G